MKSSFYPKESCPQLSTLKAEFLPVYSVCYVVQTDQQMQIQKSVFTVVADLQLQIHTKAIHDAQRVTLPGIPDQMNVLPKVTTFSRPDEDYQSDDGAEEL
jgi:hypothetical protein